MRKGLLILTPFALAAGLAVACSSPDRQAFTPPAPSATATGFGPTAPPPDAGGTQGCSESKTEISRIPVVIQLVVDESGSMIGDKWKAQTGALGALFNDLKAAADPATFVGVTMFDDEVNTTIKPDTMLNASHVQQLLSAATKNSPSGGGTGTLAALEDGYASVEGFVPSSSSGLVLDEMKRVVVLVSDGEPSGGDTEQTSCVNLAGQKFGLTAPKGPILTFSIGIGPFPATGGYDPVFMGKVAQRGGTAPQGCNPAAKALAGLCHFQVTPGQNAVATQQALVDAFTKIRAATASCEFSFTVNDQTDLSNVKVEITDKDGNKTPVDKDAENGWSFDDESNPTKILLNGDACSVSSGTVSARVDVVVGCRGAN